MKNVIIVGASGMIGGIVLRECLADPSVGTVTSIVRTASGASHQKLNEVVHSDFGDFTGIRDRFSNQHIAYFCIGVYTGTVSREDFRRITVDYTAAFADALHDASPAATFCFLSGAGADRTESSRMMFAKDKGIAENYLMSKDFDALYIFRPAYIYPVVPRQEPNFSYRVFRRLYPIMKSLSSRSTITSEQLAAGMTIAGTRGAPHSILENKDIRALVEKASSGQSM